jgi:thioredoxin 1
MSDPSDPSPPFLIACLCAAWCRTCDEYRPTFDALAAEFAGRARFAWVDIEDDEAALGDVDVLDFPTLLVARGDAALFFGPVMPHAQTARQLIERAIDGALPVVVDEALSGLPKRIHGLR